MTRKLNANSIAGSAVFYAVFLLLPVQNVSAQMFHVDSVRSCSAPTIRNDTLFYTLDFYFQERPVNYLSYYDGPFNAVVVEFIDNFLLMPEVTFPQNSPFKGLRVKAVETKMALSGIMTRMVIRFDKGLPNQKQWNYSLTLHTSKALRLTIWNKIESYQEKMAKEKRARFASSFIIGLSLSLAIAVTGLIVFLNLDTAGK
jgi:hypothetical protein